MIATTIFRAMRSNLSFSRRSRSVASFVPFWSLETAGFGDPEKRLTGVVFLGLSPTAMPKFIGFFRRRRRHLSAANPGRSTEWWENPECLRRYHPGKVQWRTD
jgi:hypothetical protein